MNRWYPLAAGLAAVLAPLAARAQPVTHPSDTVPHPSDTVPDAAKPSVQAAPVSATPPAPGAAQAPPEAAKVLDDKQLAAELSAITQDPAVHVDDPRARAMAQQLMTEGVRQLRAKAYDQALANFLAAYDKLPSPKILLDVAATLRDMGRLADAANTYQRYIADPATGAERVAEVKSLLLDLDRHLTLLTVRVFPRGSELSIDGGPFIVVGSSLQTRVRPGLHLVRIRKGDASNELTVNGFEGEAKDVPATLEVAVAEGASHGHEAKSGGRTAKSGGRTAKSGGRAAKSGDRTAKSGDQTAGSGERATGIASPATGPTASEPAAPEHVDGWLITGTHYSTDSGTSRERHVVATGTVVQPLFPDGDNDDGDLVASSPAAQREISSGAIGVLRIDGKGRGLAAGLGIAYTPKDHLELELAVLRSALWGGYAGARYRFLTGWLRPYAGIGIPVFFFKDNMDQARVSVGGRIAGGVELMINGHLSVQGDVGIEHFFGTAGSKYEETVFVPTLGLIGRM